VAFGSTFPFSGAFVVVAVFPLAGAFFSSFFGSTLTTSSAALALFLACNFWTTL